MHMISPHVVKNMIGSLGWGIPHLSSQQVGQSHKVVEAYQHDEQWVTHYKQIHVSDPNSCID